MLLSLLLAAAPLAAPDDPPSFLVVLLDDVGRDKVACYGDHPEPAATPNMDRLAAQGMLFRNAWAYPTCSPTRAALLTGRYAERTGIGSVLRVGDGVQTPLSRHEFTIPHALPGHTSVSLGKWHLNDGGDAAAHARLLGFDAYVGWRGNNDYFVWDDDLNGVRVPASGYYPTSLAGHVLRAVEEIEGPYFLYYCPHLAHSPYHEPPAHLHPASVGGPPSDRRHHLQMVEAMDTILGRIMDAVDLEDTYLIVIGDNGSPNSTVSWPFAMNHVKASVFEGGVRVPFLVAGPGVARGAECERLVQVTDLLRTLVELAGAPPPPRGAEDSVSFAPLLADPAASHGREWLYVSRFPFPGANVNIVSERALRTDRWKVIDRDDPGGPELYDLSIDPHEVNDLLAGPADPARRALAERLLAMMPRFP